MPGPDDLKPDDKPDDLALLIEAAQASGDIARKYFRADPQTWEKDDGQGPVTVADLEISEFLQQSLLAARPNYGWLCEETDDDDARLSREAVFIVDPIDGTRAFVEGRETFSHALAIARNGVVTEAVVYLPITQELYSAQLGRGAYLNGERLAATARIPATGADILAGKANLKPEFWQNGMLGFTQHFRSSLAYRMALVGHGRFDGMITLRPSWEWDVAAGALIITEAGAQATTMRGAALRFNNPVPKLDGVIAAGPRLHKDLLARLLPPPA